MIKKIFVWVIAPCMVIDLAVDTFRLTVLEGQMKSVKQRIQMEVRKGNHG